MNISKAFKLLIGVSFYFTGSLTFAQEDPFADIKTYNRADWDRTITDCDRLAAHSNDPEHIGDGVTQEDMDKPAAIAACLSALESDPDNPRLNYQLARAYGYSGLHEESDPYRIKALNAGYPQSLFVIGYISIINWDGRSADPCYGGELVRRSAVAGRFAGLVGFPHYVQTGYFEECGDYPNIDPDEIRGFLDRAEEETTDYYHLILIERLKQGLNKKMGGQN